MAPEIGYSALLLALLVSITQVGVPFFAKRRGVLTPVRFIDKAPLVQIFLIAVAFGALTRAATADRDQRSAQTSAATFFDRNSSTTADVVAELQRFASEKVKSQSTPADVPPVDEMIERLAARLQQNPKDVQGWRTLGWSYLNTGRPTEASEAYAKAIELAPGDAELRGARIEALVASANGAVTPGARDAVEATLKIDPNDSRARFFKGLAAEQDGNKAAALASWRELLKDADLSESWVSDLKTRIGELERELGEAPAAQPGKPYPEIAGSSKESGAPAPIGTGPSAQDVQAAEQMMPADRSAMIRGMVDRLASRLDKSPRDADGWIKLIQSRMVLGETKLAK